MNRTGPKPGGGNECTPIAFGYGPFPCEKSLPFQLIKPAITEGTMKGGSVQLATKRSQT